MIRLLILAGLAYIAWMLIRSLAGRKSTQELKREGHDEANPSQDLLVEDPVCHTLVPKHQAIRVRQEGKTYYFCSEECSDAFTEQTRGEQ